LTIRNGWIEYSLEKEMEAITYNISKDDYMLILKDMSYTFTSLIGGKKLSQSCLSNFSNISIRSSINELR